MTGPRNTMKKRRSPRTEQRAASSRDMASDGRELGAPRTWSGRRVLSRCWGSPSCSPATGVGVPRSGIEATRRRRAPPRPAARQHPPRHARHDEGGSPRRLRIRAGPHAAPGPAGRRRRALRMGVQLGAHHAALARDDLHGALSVRARRAQQRQLLPRRPVPHPRDRAGRPGLPDGGLRERLRAGPALRPRARLRGVRRPHAGRAGPGREPRSGAPGRPHGGGAGSVAGPVRRRSAVSVRRRRCGRPARAVLRLAAPLRPARAVPRAATLRRGLSRRAVRRRGRLRRCDRGLGARQAAPVGPARFDAHRHRRRSRGESRRPRRRDPLDVRLRQRHQGAVHSLAPGPPVAAGRAGTRAADRRGAHAAGSRRGAGPSDAARPKSGAACAGRAGGRVAAHLRRDLPAGALFQLGAAADAARRALEVHRRAPAGALRRVARSRGNGEPVRQADADGRGHAAGAHGTHRWIGGGYGGGAPRPRGAGEAGRARLHRGRRRAGGTAARRVARRSEGHDCRVQPPAAGEQRRARPAVLRGTADRARSPA